MKKSRQSPKKTENGKSVKRSPENLAVDQTGTTGKCLVRDLLFGVLICLCFFAIVEAGLRFFWNPTISETEDPFVGFSATHPLFTEQNGTVSIAKSRLKYFNEASFSAVKPANTFRIFAFGGSTTYGHPFNWRTSFPRWLEEILNSCDNGVKYEVVNLGGISYASYRILPLMKQTLAYKPDLFVVYTGQNEFLERRSYSTLIEKNSYVLTLEAYLEKLRIYKGMKRVLKGESSESPKKPALDQTAKTILHDEASAILDRSAGLDLYHRDEEFARGVALHFRHNLNALIDLSESAAIPLIFVSPASNLRDFSPFKSEHEQSLSAREKAGLDKKLETIGKLIKSGDYQNAHNQLETIFSKVKDHAQANFMMAKILDGLGKSDQARDYFIRARDLDICPLRATSAIESELYSVTKSRKTPLVDFKKYIESRSLEAGFISGVAGEESFLDHVHPTIELHQQMAVLIMDRMKELGVIKNCRNLNPQELSKVFSKVMEDEGASLFVMRDLNLAKTLKWAGKKDEARAALNRILGTQENNPEIYKMLGAYALEEANYQEAISYYSRAVQLSDGDPQLKLSLAIAYYKSGDRISAKRIYEKMISDKEATPDIIANLSMSYLEENRVEDAASLLKKSMADFPDSSLLYAPYALAMAMSGDLKTGLKWMRKASEAEPGDPSPLYNLAGMFALANDSANCFKSLNLAIDRGYTNAEKLKTDPIFSSVRNNSQFYQILERISQ